MHTTYQNQPAYYQPPQDYWSQGALAQYGGSGAYNQQWPTLGPPGQTPMPRPQTLSRTAVPDGVTLMPGAMPPTPVPPYARPPPSSARQGQPLKSAMKKPAQGDGNGPGLHRTRTQSDPARVRTYSDPRVNPRSSKSHSPQGAPGQP